MDELKIVIKQALEELYPKEYMTVEEWAKYQGISRAFAYQQLEKKSFPQVVFRMGKRTFIIRKLWDEYAEKQAKLGVAM